MDRTEHPQVTDHAAVSGTTIHGRQAILLALLPLSGGIFPLLAACGILPVDRRDFDVPPLVVGAVGAVFVVAGSALLAHGVAGLRRERRTARVALERPDAPELTDHPWVPDGAWDDSTRGLAWAAVGALLAALFAVPITWMGLRDGVPGAVRFGMAVAALVALPFVLRPGVRLARRLRHGRHRVRFARFPFRLGETLELTFVPACDLRALDALRVELRCVQEEYVRVRRGRHTRMEVVARALHSEVRAVDAEVLAHADLQELPLRFDLPAEPAWATSLATRPARSWELVVRGAVTGPDLFARFLLPVYAPAETDARRAGIAPDAPRPAASRRAAQGTLT